MTNRKDPMDLGDFYEHLRNGGTPENFDPTKKDPAKLWRHKLTAKDRKFLKSCNIKAES